MPDRVPPLPTSRPPDCDEFFISPPDMIINRAQSACFVSQQHLPEPEFSRSGLLSRVGHPFTRCSGPLNFFPLQRQFLRERRFASSPPSATLPYHDDHRRYRFLRTLAPSPHRSPFHTSTVSLPDIKEATNEENESSSSNSVERDQNRITFLGQKPSQEELKLVESSNKIIAVDNQTVKKNANSARRCHSQQLEPSSHIYKSSLVQPSYQPGSADVVYAGRTTVVPETHHGDERSQRPPASVIGVQITVPRSSRASSKNQNEKHRSNKNTIFQSRGASNGPDYASDRFISPRSYSNVPESPRSYSSDSSKQPKSILKQRLASSSSPTTYNDNDGTLGRYVGRIQINDSVQKKQEQNSGTVREKEHSGASNSSVKVSGEDTRLYLIMQENLRQQKQRPQTFQVLPQASFDGPFFTLEEVKTREHRANSVISPTNDCLTPPIERGRGNVQNLFKKHWQHSIDDCSEEPSQKQRYSIEPTSASVIELNKRAEKDNPEIGGRVVYWPPPSPSKQERRRAQSVPPSLKTKSITDPDRIDEYRRQKELELKSIRRREEEAMLWRHKQTRALELQERLYYEQLRSRDDRGSPESVEVMTQSREELRQIDLNAQKLQQELEESPEPHFMRIYETRPITAVSVGNEPQEVSISPNSVTWKRVYIVNRPKPVAKNEIITSEQLLERERFNVDLLKRREAFIEIPKPEPTIFRTGKRWQPPPEQPYVWPNVDRVVHSEQALESNSNYSIDSVTGRTVEGAEFRWQPIVYEPEYKLEHKNFTPENSLLNTPRGFGPGSLDEPAKRQIKYLIQPSPDGSHRPKPAFGGPRATPSGGFYPHAPNAIKVLKRHSQSMTSLKPSATDPDEEVEIIHQRRFHRLGDVSPSPALGHHSICSDIADWEKIYDLPPHSSTITPRDTPRNVNVRGKLVAFENASRQATPLVHQCFNVGDVRRPVSSVRRISTGDGSKSNFAPMGRNEQYLRQHHQQPIRHHHHHQQHQQQLSPASAHTDSGHRSLQQRQCQRQPTPFGGSLLHRIDQRDRDEGSHVRHTIPIPPETRHYQDRKVLLAQISSPPPESPDCSHHQQRSFVVRSSHVSTPFQHHQSAQSVTSRRLTRIPLEHTSERSGPQVVEVQRPPSRMVTAIHQQPSSNVGYSSTMS